MSGEEKKHPARASNMERTKLCPAAPWAELAIPDLDSEAAIEGRLIHRVIPYAFRDGNYDGIENDDQRYAVESCVGFLNRILSDMGGRAKITFEKTMPVIDSDGIRIIDREVTADVVIEPEREPDLMVIIDWKSGRKIPHVAASGDLQLRTYSVAARNNATKSIRRVIAYRFHPRVFDEMRETCVEFGESESAWRGYEDELRAIVFNSTEDSERVPGEIQCRYCKAKAICPAFDSWQSAQVNEAEKSLEVSKPMEVWTLEQLGAAFATIGKYHEAIKIILNRIDDVQSLVTMALQRGQVVSAPDGTRYTLAPGRERRVIDDVMAARKALDGKVSALGLLKACSVSVTALENVFKAETGNKGKPGSDEFCRIMMEAGAMEKRENKPIIVPMRCDICSDPIYANEATIHDEDFGHIHAACADQIEIIEANEAS